MCDRAHVLEGLPWLDQIRKPRLDAIAVGVLDGHGRAGHSDDRVQDAEAATVGLEARFRDRIRFEDQGRAGLRRNADVDRKAGRIRTLAKSRVADRESIVLLVDLQVVISGAYVPQSRSRTR
jgi:hypothetical protein